ncbi:DUF1667 domain-containing protein [Clostridium sp. MSJ-4]|uniref:DUF1667 domain-containing protein n=1 Tax=Clostridium simiarum TaxID=2841506 RepID=A0ABS6F349_9CLOT|nr:DUF1667 domain-containing protein [Clostridium simiarum]MBU5592937.1 DUF1667 domain-containing protein [Clostridium simiarum]
MTKRELVCIGCPMGCMLEVEIEGKEVIRVTGNTCKKGEEYGIKECTNPTRIITSSVKVEEGDIDMVPVKTEKDVPKGKILDCIKALKGLKVIAPINIGDVVLENIAGTGVNVIATRKIDMK